MSPLTLTLTIPPHTHIPQMAGLVLEQGETLQRIEDDVEAGLEQTVQVRNGAARGGCVCHVTCVLAVLPSRARTLIPPSSLPPIFPLHDVGTCGDAILL